MDYSVSAVKAGKGKLPRQQWRKMPERCESSVEKMGRDVNGFR